MLWWQIWIVAMIWSIKPKILTVRQFTEKVTNPCSSLSATHSDQSFYIVPWWIYHFIFFYFLIAHVIFLNHPVEFILLSLHLYFDYFLQTERKVLENRDLFCSSWYILSSWHIEVVQSPVIAWMNEWMNKGRWENMVRKMRVRMKWWQCLVTNKTE